MSSEMRPPPTPPHRAAPSSSPPHPPRRSSSQGEAAERFFAEIEALPPGEEREQELAARARENPELVKEVRALLAAHAAAGDFMHTGTDLTPEIERELARLKPEEAGESAHPHALTGEQKLVFYGYTSPLVDVEFSPDGTLIGAITTDGFAKVWDRKTSAEATLRGSIRKNTPAPADALTFGGHRYQLVTEKQSWDQATPRRKPWAGTWRRSRAGRRMIGSGTTSLQS